MAEKVHVITSVERRRRFTDEEKRQIVAEAAMPGASVSAVARNHGIAPNLLFAWRKALLRGSGTLHVPGLPDALAQRVEELRSGVIAVRQQCHGKVARFPDELRSQALAIMTEGVTAAELVMATGLPPTTVSHWRQDAAGAPVRELKFIPDTKAGSLTRSGELVTVRLGPTVSIELPMSALKDEVLWQHLFKIGGKAP